jgi:hypothetical protein
MAIGVIRCLSNSLHCSAAGIVRIFRSSALILQDEAQTILKIVAHCYFPVQRTSQAVLAVEMKPTVRVVVLFVVIVGVPTPLVYGVTEH